MLAVVLLLCIGVFFFISGVDRKKTTSNEVPVFDGKNSTFVIEGTNTTLVNGISQTNTTPDSASKTITRYFGNEVSGDLNGNGLADIAFLVTQDRSGSGLFYYAVVALKNKSGYTITNTFFIGDRIAPQSTTIDANTKELLINFAERKPNEAMTAEPTVGATVRLKITAEGRLEKSTPSSVDNSPIVL